MLVGDIGLPTSPTTKVVAIALVARSRPPARALALLDAKLKPNTHQDICPKNVAQTFRQNLTNTRPGERASCNLYTVCNLIHESHTRLPTRYCARA